MGEKIEQLGPHIFPTHNAAMVQWFWQFNTNLNEHTPKWREEKTRNYLPKTSKHVMNDNQNTLKESCQKSGNFLSNFPLARFLPPLLALFIIIIIFNSMHISWKDTQSEPHTSFHVFITFFSLDMCVVYGWASADGGNFPRSQSKHLKLSEHTTAHLSPRWTMCTILHVLLPLTKTSLWNFQKVFYIAHSILSHNVIFVFGWRWCCVFYEWWVRAALSTEWLSPSSSTCHCVRNVNAFEMQIDLYARH